MHEQSLVRNLLRQVDQIRRDNDAERIVEVRMEMGPLSGVEPSLLASAFDQLGCEDTVKSASLVIDQVELLAECGSCSEQFEVRGFYFRCPLCGGNVKVIRGDQLQLVSVSLESETTRRRNGGMTMVTRTITVRRDVAAEAKQDAGVERERLARPRNAGHQPALFARIGEDNAFGSNGASLGRPTQHGGVGGRLGNRSRCTATQSTRSHGAANHGRCVSLGVAVGAPRSDAIGDPQVDFLFIENVGNLVCPASHDLGEHCVSFWSARPKETTSQVSIRKCFAPATRWWSRSLISCRMSIFDSGGDRGRAGGFSPSWK